MKSISNLLIIFLTGIIFLCFNACSNKVKLNKINPYKLELIPTDTTFFKNVRDISKLFYFYDNIKDKEYLINYDKNSNNLIIFNYETGNIIKETKIDFKINSLYIKNIDSIYISFDNAFGEKGNIFGIINSEGKIIERINLYNIMVIPEIDSTGNFNLNGDKFAIQLADNPYSFNNFAIFNDTMYMNIMIKQNIHNKYLYPALAILKKGTNLIKYAYNYPNFYKESNYNANYIDFIVKKDKKNVTNIINSFILSDSIYINRLVPKYEANNFNIITDKDYDSLLIKPMKSKYRNIIIQQNLSIHKHFAELFTFKYIYIKNDPFRNCFYRIAIHDINDNIIDKSIIASNSNDEIINYARKIQNWSIIVANSNLNVITEKLITAKEGFSPDILITKNGIGLVNITNSEENIVTNEENIVTNDENIEKIDENIEKIDENIEKIDENIEKIDENTGINDENTGINITKTNIIITKE